MIDESTGEIYVALTADAPPSFLVTEIPNPAVRVEGVNAVQRDVVEALTFVPYFFRANRGGTGQMRVGLRRLR